MGEELIAAKGLCEHGEWLPWLEDNFGWTEWTARNLMRVAKVFGKSGTVLNFERRLAMDTKSGSSTNGR
jgi:hypothetical protein